MPTCIYCIETKSNEEFSKEHVLTHAFCGTGQNWTLVDAVCIDCNSLFSAFETHWTHNAIESVMRNFSGPIGRNKRLKNRRTQPTEVDYLYIVQRNDQLAYEAGFAFPNEFYFRPQIIQCEDGLFTLAADRRDAPVLKKAINDLIKLQTVKLCMPTEEGESFNIVTLSVDFLGRKCSLESESIDKNPQGYWLRRYPDPPKVKGINGIEGHLSPRAAVDDRKRLYFRVEKPLDVVDLLRDLLQDKNSSQKHPNAVSPDDQTIAIGVRIKLPLVYRAVLKTGLNLFAHFAGASMARDPAFDDLRNMLLDEQADHDVMKRCKLLDVSSPSSTQAEFPPPSDLDQHRLMLDVFGGKLCFRMRLYGSLGYECVLAPATAAIQRAISKERVVVDFNSTGIRKVAVWP